MVYHETYPFSEERPFFPVRPRPLGWFPRSTPSLYIFAFSLNSLPAFSCSVCHPPVCQSVFLSLAGSASLSSHWLFLDWVIRVFWLGFLALLALPLAGVGYLSSRFFRLFSSALCPLPSPPPPPKVLYFLAFCHFSSKAHRWCCVSSSSAQLFHPILKSLCLSYPLPTTLSLLGSGEGTEHEKKIGR